MYLVGLGGGEKLGGFLPPSHFLVPWAGSSSRWPAWRCPEEQGGEPGPGPCPQPDLGSSQVPLEGMDGLCLVSGCCSLSERSTASLFLGTFKLRANDFRKQKRVLLAKYCAKGPENRSG